MPSKEGYSGLRGRALRKIEYFPLRTKSCLSKASSFRLGRVVEDLSEKNATIFQLWSGSRRFSFCFFFFVRTKAYKLTSQTVTIKGVSYVIFLDDNGITELDLSKIQFLERLYCSGNQLTELDVTQNTKLVYLYCANNNIKGEKMTALVSGLCDRKSAAIQGFLSWNGGDNQMTDEQKAIAEGKNQEVD